MDIIATIITGIYWGVIIDACWIIPYFALLFYHFWKMEEDPAYAMRYERSERMVKKMGVKKAVIQESMLPVVWSQLKSWGHTILGFCESAFLFFKEKAEKAIKGKKE